MKHVDVRRWVRVHLDRVRPAGTEGDEGAGIMMVLMAMLVATTLSLLVLGTLVAQVTPNQFDRKNTRAIHAAEAGIDVALNRIRSAQSQDPLAEYQWTGDRSKLPCSLTGPVDGYSPDQLSYNVAIRYYAEDPANQTETWRTNKALSCTEGAGTATQPAFALLLADGTGKAIPKLSASAGNRRLETIYDFRLTNANISGGVIRNYQDGKKDTRLLCWDAGSAMPVAGRKLTLENCDDTKPQQLFSWRKDYTIALAQTVKPGDVGLCVELSSTVTDKKRPVQLAKCDPAADRQRFGFNNSAHFDAYVESKDWCPTQENDNAVGNNLVATTAACGEGQGRKSSWQPTPTVGAGSVGDVGNDVEDVDRQPLQWVNYREFGRCFDITNWSVDSEYMIAYPCKQDVDDNVGWNQTLEWNASTKQLYTYKASSNSAYQNSWPPKKGTQYCVTTPTQVNGFVTMKTCTSGRVDQQWTINRELPGNYTSSYTVVDYKDRCMSVVPGPGGGGDGQWSRIIVATCNGGGQQKWNAPPDPTKPSLRDTRELNS